jgi:hypothetical protein
VLVNESIRDYEALKNVDRVLKQFGYPKEASFIDDYTCFINVGISSMTCILRVPKCSRRGGSLKLREEVPPYVDSS